MPEILSNVYLKLFFLGLILIGIAIWEGLLAILGIWRNEQTEEEIKDEINDKMIDNRSEKDRNESA